MSDLGNDRVPTTRRAMLRGASGALALGALTSGLPEVADAGQSEGTAIKNGRIKQSIVHWCFEKYWDIPRTIEVARQLGCGSIELIEPKYFPLLKKAGLECAIGQIDMNPDPPFVKGFNNPKYHAQVIQATRDAIDACAEYGFKKVICFTGFAEGISPEVGATNCVEGFKRIVPYAGKKGITLCLERFPTTPFSSPGIPRSSREHRNRTSLARSA